MDNRVYGYSRVSTREQNKDRLDALNGFIQHRIRKLLDLYKG